LNMLRRKKKLLFFCVLLAALLAGGVYFGVSIWRDREYHAAVIQKKNRPVAKIGDRVYSYSDFYAAIDTARGFGVQPKDLLQQYFEAELQIEAGRKMRIFPNAAQIKEASSQIFVPQLGGQPLPEGFPPPRIYTTDSNWKTLQSTAQAVFNVAKDTGREAELQRVKDRLYKKIYQVPFEDYPEGR
jgi:hypothetical protein